jgi:hypothetical protein
VGKGERTIPPAQEIRIRSRKLEGVYNEFRIQHQLEGREYLYILRRRLSLMVRGEDAQACWELCVIDTAFIGILPP